MDITRKLHYIKRKKHYLLLIISFLCTLSSVKANRIYVTNTNDSGSGSLRAQVAAATPGDTIIIDVAGTLLLQSEINISSDLAIIGPAPIHFTIDYNGLGAAGEAVFSLSGGNPNLYVEGIRFANGSTISHAINTAPTYTGQVKIKSSLFESNANTVLNLDGGSISIHECSFIGNNSPNEAGAIRNDANSLKIFNSTFYNNESVLEGGAIFLGSIAGGVEITHCTFFENGNLSAPAGSTIYNSAPSTVRITNNIIFNDTQSDALLDGPSAFTSQGGNITNDMNTAGMPAGSDIQSLSLNVGFTIADLITDGWGMKYFSPSPGADGIDIDQNPEAGMLFDQRRVWRVMDGGAFAEYSDAGAIEYSQLTVFADGSGNTGTLDDLYQFTYNTAGIGKKAFVFEITGAGPHLCTSGFMAFDLFEDSTILNGFTQNGSVIPGPGTSPNTVTPAYTPIIITRGSGSATDGISISGNGSILAGISIGGDYDKSLIIDGPSFNPTVEVSGCHIGVNENGSAYLANTAAQVYVGEATLNLGNKRYCGHNNKSNRNIISGGINYQIKAADFSTVYAANNFVGSNSLGNNIPTGTSAVADTGVVTNGTGAIYFGLFNKPNEFNLVMGQDIGICIRSGSNDILSNRIGTLLDGNSINANSPNTVGIVLDGSNSTNNFIGVPGRANIIASTAHGIDLLNLANNNYIRSNHIGIGRNGTTALPGTGTGIFAQFNADNNYIGGIGEGNIIGNCVHGIELKDAVYHTVVRGNLIGFQSDTLTSAVNSGNGIYITDYAEYNMIGGCNSGEGNYIGNNNQNGIYFQNPGADNDTVYGNFIGVDVNGGDAGNFNAGINFSGGVFNIRVGDAATGCGNEIAFNDSGILTGGSGNNTELTISGNSIYLNDFEGIDIDGDGPNGSANDTAPADNNNATAPYLFSAVNCGGSTILSIGVEINATVRFEAFKADDSEEGDSLILQEDIPMTFGVPYDWNIGNLPLGTIVTVTASYGANFKSTGEFSVADTVKLLQTPTVNTSNSTVCEMTTSPPTLTASNYAGTPVWFSDPGLTSRVDSGEVITPNPSFFNSAGTVNFYVADSVGGCFGPAGSVTITVTPPSSTTINGPDTVCSVAGNLVYTGPELISYNSYTWQWNPEGSPGSSFYNSIILNSPVINNEDSVTLDFNPSFDGGTQDTLLLTIDSAGCLITAEKYIAVESAPDWSMDSLVHPSSCGGTDGSIGLGFGFTGTNYAIYYNSGTVVNTTPDANGYIFIPNLPAGSYVVDSIISPYCQDYLFQSYVLNDPMAPMITGVIFNDPATCGGNGSMDVTIQNPNSLLPIITDVDLDYLSTNAGVEQSFTGLNILGLSSSVVTATNLLAADTTVTTINLTANGCSSTFNVNYTFVERAPPVVNAGLDMMVCENDPVTFAGSPSGAGYTYSWTFGDGNTSTNSSDVNTYFGSGTYNAIFSATDNSTNCVGSDTAVVTVSSAPLVSVNPGNNVCEGSAHTYSSTSVTGSSPFTYSWAPAGDFVDATISNPTTNLLIPNTYSHTLTVSDINGCTSAPVTSTLTVDPRPNIGNPFVMDVSCFGDNTGSVILAPVGTYNYSWTGPITSTSQDLNNAPAGTYNLVATDGATGCTLNQNFTITQPSTALTLTTSNTNASCSGIADGTATATAAGGTAGYNYEWFSDPSYSTQIGTTNTLTGLVAGTYYVQVTDNNFCTEQDSAIITEPSAMNVSTVVSSNYNGEDISCAIAADGEVTATVSGGAGAPYSYQWYAGGTLLAGETSTILTNQPAGTYTVQVTDANSCPDSSTIVLVDPTPISINAGIDTTICEDESVQLNAIATGGTGALSYSWSPAGGLSNSAISNPVATPNLTTTYGATATDINGCVQVDDLVVTVNAKPSFTASHTNVTCSGLSDGVINTTITSGVTPYQLSTDNGVTYLGAGITSASGLGANTYTVVIRDANNCVSDDTTVTVTEPLALSFTTSSIEDTCSRGVGELIVTATGGVTAYQYSINNGLSFVASSSFSNLPAATYPVIVTDANGCTEGPFNETVIEVTGVQLSINSASPSVSCFGDSDGFINIDVTGALTPVTYSWTETSTTFTSNNEDIASLFPGTYQVIATDNGQCKDTLTHIITEPNALIAAATSVSESCDGLDNGVLDTLSVTGGAGGISYQWLSLPGNTVYASGATVTSVTPGDYILVATDANNCESRDTVVVELGEVYTPLPVINSNTGSCVGANTYDFADDNFVPPSGASSFFWTFAAATPATSNQQNPTGVTFNSPGTNAVTYQVTSNAGCVFSGLLDVTINAGPNANAGVDQNACQGDQVILSVTPNGLGYSYVWTEGGTGQPVGGAATVNVFPNADTYYVVSVTENSTGCIGQDSISVFVTGNLNMPTVDQTGPLQFCELTNGVYGYLTATSNTPNFGAFNWYLGSQSNAPVTSDSLLLDENNIINGWIYVEETLGPCTSNADSISVTFEVNDLVIDSLVMYCPDTPIFIDHSASGDITWAPNPDIVQGTNPLQVNPTGETVLYITNDMSNCVYTDSIAVMLNPDCDSDDEVSTNAFTPDGDGINDYFFIDIPVISSTENNVVIFNRWGDEINSFRNYNNLDVVWDGTSASGEELPGGTYFYIIELPELEIKKTGWIQLVK